MMSLVLTPCEADAEPPPALPGQYWVLHARSGVRVAAVTGGACDGLEVTTLRVPCGGAFGEPGTILGVRGPFGTGWDLRAASGRPLLLAAWESGLATLRPVLDQVVAGTERYAGVRIWVGGSRTSALPLHADADLWVARGMDVTIATGPRLSMADVADGRPGPPPGTVALLAGPVPMTLEAARRLADRGVAAHRIQVAAHSLIRCTDAVCGRCHVGGRRAERTLLACKNGPVFGYDQLVRMD